MHTWRTRFLTITLLILAAGLAHAAEEEITSPQNLDPFCWTTLPFADVFRAEATYNPQANPHDGSLVTVPFTAFEWVGPESYVIAGAGVARSSRPVLGSFEVDVSLANRSTFWFNGAPLCAMTATLDARPFLDEAEKITNPAFLGGPVTIRCAGGTSPFSRSGTMALADCDHAMQISRELMVQGVTSLMGHPQP